MLEIPYFGRVVVFPSGGVGLVSWCVGVSSGSPPSSFAAACEDGGLWLPVLLRRGASLSCGCAIAEDGDFPAASNPVIRTKVSSVPPGGSADVGAAARPCPASKIVLRQGPRDLDVILQFSGVCCNTVVI